MEIIQHYESNMSNLYRQCIDHKGTKRFFRVNGPGNCPSELEIPRNVDLIVIRLSIPFIKNKLIKDNPY